MAKTTKISREQYEQYLKRKGYEIEGDIVRLDTPYGTSVEKIVEDGYGFGLISISNPFTKAMENNEYSDGEADEDFIEFNGFSGIVEVEMEY